VNLLGAVGVLGGLEEGLELNVLGLTLGIDPKNLAIKLPLIGRLGFGAKVEAVRLGDNDQGVGGSQNKN
jgi:hypothetical protein